MPETEGANRGAAGEMLPRQVLTPGRHSVLVRLTAAPGMRPALLEVLNTYVDTLRHEPGTEMLVVSIDPDDVNNVWLYETFKDDQAQDAHRAAEGFAVMIRDMPEFLTDPPALLRLDPLRMSMQDSLLENDWSF